MGKIVFPKLTPIQQEIDDYPARFKVLSWGRRAGKSVYGRFKSLDAAINGGLKGWYLFPTYNNARSHWRAINRMIGDLPSRRLEREMYLEFEREGRVGSLEIKSAHEPKNLRGSGLDFVVVDEAAYMQEEIWYDVIRPSLADKLGWALLISTPNGTANWFYQMYVAGLDPLQPDWMSWLIPTASNPYISPAEIEAARRDLPELRFRQEFLAEFLSDAGGVFRGIESAAHVEDIENPRDGFSYDFGIDWGRQNDFTVISIMERETHNQVHIERFSEIGYEVQIGRLDHLIEKWRPIKVYAEANSMGGPLVEQLQEGYGTTVEGVYMTNEIKRDMTERLANDLEKGLIGIVSQDSRYGKVQVAELGAYQIKRTASGLAYTYAAASGWNDDTVVALMMSNRGRFYGGPTIKFMENPFYR